MHKSNEEFPAVDVTNLMHLMGCFKLSRTKCKMRAQSAPCPCAGAICVSQLDPATCNAEPAWLPASR